LVDTEEVEELKDTDLAVLDLTEEGESKDSDEGYDANRDEGNQVDEQL
jgi:hypothetical protein